MRTRAMRQASLCTAYPPPPPLPPILPPPTLLQAHLMEVTAGLADKRAQLDRVATMLLARQKDLEYEAQKAGLTAEGGCVVGRQSGTRWSFPLTSPPPPACRAAPAGTAEDPDGACRHRPGGGGHEAGAARL